MIRPNRLLSSLLVSLLVVAACSSGPSSTGTPAASVAGGASTAGRSAPAAAAASPGAPCSFLTAQQVGTVVGTTPVKVAERAGRGDCDYFLTAAMDSKVNVGVFSGSDATSYYESTKGIGTPKPVTLGDEAYSIVNASIGTVVVARKGGSVVAVQVFAGAAADQLRQATSLAELVLARL